MSCCNHSLEYLRHSAAHLLAQALIELYPDTILTIGPATETGFFYDIIRPSGNIKLDELTIISEKMKEIVCRNLTLTHYQVSKEKARELFKHNSFKLDIIETQIQGDTAGIAQQGDFIDLCKGGHVKSTGELGNFLLTGISGSYWRGNREGQALQRISGIIFHTKEELDAHLVLQEQLAMYDHRKLGNEMELFSFHDEGHGFPFFHPKGMAVINSLVNYMRELARVHGYQEVKTPTLLSNELWKKSGHYAHYKHNMYTLCIEEHEHAVKPMNCPGMFLIYTARPRSYRELPFRMSEFGHVHRHELSGVLSGLTRVRAFTQDDAHIFCSINQIEHEIINIMNMLDKAMQKTGFLEYVIKISTRPESYAGTIENWNIAESALKNALMSMHKLYDIQEGEGAFYGPKIEIQLKDSLGRFWQCGTIQLDFVQPENFDMSFINEKGQSERVVVIHQAIYGSLERFFALLLEHHKGKLPAWLAPIQCRILTITDVQKEYGEKVYNELLHKGIRIEMDYSSDPLNGKIQRAQKDKAFCMIIIGKKEQEQHTISVRFLDGSQKMGISQSDLLDLLSQ
jgi:threonyl-tRNA synthetase